MPIDRAHQRNMDRERRRKETEYRNQNIILFVIVLIALIGAYLQRM